MASNARKRNGFVWLEALLVLAVLLLSAMIFPFHFVSLLRSMDPHRWARGVWTGLNGGLILTLLMFRFSRELTAARRSLFSRRRSPTTQLDRETDESDSDYEARNRRDAEWRERSRNRLPFT